MKLGLISLGCDKNTVDSERILAALGACGAEPSPSIEEAEVVLINTCGFIDAAKQESIETILDAGRLKEEGACKAVVAVGCLVERHREELASEIPEVDLFLGLRDLDRLVPELQRRGLLRKGPVHPGERLPLEGRSHVRYLKVSEGCDHGCAFCAIPLWRGRHRSFATEKLVAEAQRLELQGTVELNLVAQDLAHYGREFRDGTDISTLLARLVEETRIPWMRLLYIYSAGLRKPLLDLMATEDRILPYVDMPIQHASDAVLARMRRPERRDSLRRKLAWLRESVPGITLRTTVLVGFPGETDDDFKALLDFLEEARFDRLGAFAFSPQEGTRAAGLEEHYVPDSLARARLEEVLEVQRSLSAERLRAEMGEVREAIVDSPANGSSPAVGRVASQADDVDGVTHLIADAELQPGQIVRARVAETHDFDLTAEVMCVTREAPANGAPLRAGRVAGGSASPGMPARDEGGPAFGKNRRPAGKRLPVAALGLETAWGR